MSQQINLFNPAYARPRQTLSAMSMLQVLAVLVTVTVLVAALVPALFSGLEKQARVAAAGREMATAQLLKLRADDAAGARSRLLDDGIRTTTGEIRSMQQIIDALRKDPIGDTSGYSSYLQAFARHGVDGLWLTGFSIAGAGRDMALQGRALQPELVAVYLNNLKHATILKGFTFSTLEIASRADSGYVEFDLRSPGMAPASPVPPVVAPAPTPKTSRTTGAKS